MANRCILLLCINLSLIQLKSKKPKILPIILLVNHPELIAAQLCALLEINLQFT